MTPRRFVLTFLSFIFLVYSFLAIYQHALLSSSYYSIENSKLASIETSSSEENSAANARRVLESLQAKGSTSATLAVAAAARAAAGGSVRSLLDRVAAGDKLRHDRDFGNKISDFPRIKDLAEQQNDHDTDDEDMDAKTDVTVRLGVTREIASVVATLANLYMSETKNNLAIQLSLLSDSADPASVLKQSSLSGVFTSQSPGEDWDSLLELPILGQAMIFVMNPERGTSATVSAPFPPILKLSPSTLCGVLQGTISYWNAAQILADNPAVVALPSLPIRILRPTNSIPQTFLQGIRAVCENDKIAEDAITVADDEEFLDILLANENTLTWMSLSEATKYKKHLVLFDLSDEYGNNERIIRAGTPTLKQRMKDLENIKSIISERDLTRWASSFPEPSWPFLSLVSFLQLNSSYLYHNQHSAISSSSSLSSSLSSSSASSSDEDEDSSELAAEFEYSCSVQTELHHFLEWIIFYSTRAFELIVLQGVTLQIETKNIWQNNNEYKKLNCQNEQLEGEERKNLRKNEKERKLETHYEDDEEQNKEQEEEQRNVLELRQRRKETDKKLHKNIWMG